MTDELSAPLGQNTAGRKRRFRLPFSALQALAALLGLFLAAFAGFAIFGDNPFGGEPIAHIAIREKSPGDEKSTAMSQSAADHDAKPAAKQVAKTALAVKRAPAKPVKSAAKRATKKPAKPAAKRAAARRAKPGKKPMAKARAKAKAPAAAKRAKPAGKPKAKSAARGRRRG